MSKSKRTVSDVIVGMKLGYTPPEIFKQRDRLIKLIAEASIALNEQIKVTDDPDFIKSFDDEDERAAAVAEAIGDREELEHNLARHVNNLMYYDQEDWSQSGHDCARIMANIEEEWEERKKEGAA